MVQPISDKADQRANADPRPPKPKEPAWQYDRIAEKRLEVATAILAGFAASPRGQGLDQVVSSAIEWADYLLRKLDE